MALATKPKPKHLPTHKKRTGAHHNRSTDYVKHYWPYLPMLLIVGVGLAVNILWQPASAVLGATSNLTNTALTQATNVERQQAHEGDLTINPQLTAAAQAKANDMVARNYWAHVAPDGKSPWYFIVAEGYQYDQAGENLAYGFGDANTTVTAWMNSPEHRRNILNSAYRDVGFGVASTPDFVGKGPETIVVAMYGTPAHDTAGVAGISDQSNDSGAQQVARIQTFAVSSVVGGALGMTIVMAAAGLVFIVRHGRMWHRILVRSEHVVMQHPLFDFAIVSLGVAAFVLSRTSGFVL